MKDQIQPTPSSTSPGIADSSTSKQTRKRKIRGGITGGVLDSPTSSTINHELLKDKFFAFEREIEFAKVQKEEYVEVDQDVIDIKFGGLHGSTHVCYRGILVFPTGTAEKALEEMNIPLEQRLYGKSAQGSNSVDSNG